MRAGNVFNRLNMYTFSIGWLNRGHRSLSGSFNYWDIHPETIEFQNSCSWFSSVVESRTTLRTSRGCTDDA